MTSPTTLSPPPEPGVESREDQGLAREEARLETPAEGGSGPEGQLPPLPRLPLGVRISVFIVGWVLILVGVAGLVLPGIQGVFTIVLGAALLSLDNELIYRALHRIFRRWPHLWRKVERFRHKTHDKLHRHFH